MSAGVGEQAYTNEWVLPACLPLVLQPPGPGGVQWTSPFGNSGQPAASSASPREWASAAELPPESPSRADGHLGGKQEGLKPLAMLAWGTPDAMQAPSSRSQPRPPLPSPHQPVPTQLLAPLKRQLCVSFQSMQSESRAGGVQCRRFWGAVRESLCAGGVGTEPRVEEGQGQ